MLKINTLNLSDTAATKAFLYDIMVENHQLRSAAEDADSRADMWWKAWQEERDRAAKAEGQVTHLQEVADSLAAERDAAKAAAPEGGENW